MTHPRKPSQDGLSLVELMMVAIIVSVLAIVAYPSYQDHVRRTHRVSAAACLEELSLLMEMRFSADLSYSQVTALPTTTCVTDMAGRYSIGFAPSEPTTTTFILRAVPSGPQAGDTSCSTLQVDHQGVRSVSGTAVVQSCWR